MTQIVKTAINQFREKGFSATALKSLNYIYQHGLFFLQANKFSTCSTREELPGVLNLAFRRFNEALMPRQKEPEVTALMHRVFKKQPMTMLEIGTDKGGNLFLLSKVVSPQCTIISIDLPNGEYGGGYAYWRSFLYRKFAVNKQSIFLLRCNSQTDSSFQNIKHILKGRTLDLLYIDGDHRYEGVRHDFYQYSKLMSPGGIICFHDILPNSADPSIGVPRFWNEIKHDYQHEELIADPNQNQMGIGMLIV